MTPDWDAYWGSLRAMRILAAASLLGSIAVWIALGPLGLFLGFLAVFLAYRQLRNWPCPRCRLPIAGVRFTTFPERCANCGLQVFGHVVDIEAPFTIDPAGMELTHRLRHFIAGYEVVAGGALMVMTAFASMGLAFTTLLEGLAGMSLAAGIWLWRDEMRGYQLSRTLQWAQLVRFQSPWLTYLAAAGGSLDLTHINGNITLSPSVAANLQLAWKPGLPIGVAVNLWAGMLLLVLFHARPRTAHDRSATDQDPALPAALV